MYDDISVLRTALADLVPAFQTRAAEAERLQTMPADLVLRAKQAGLFRLNLPRSLGGYELEPAVTVEIFERISRADGSAGWTMVIGSSTAFFAWLEPAVAKELIADQVGFVSTLPCGFSRVNSRTATPGPTARFSVSWLWTFQPAAVSCLSIWTRAFASRAR